MIKQVFVDGGWGGGGWEWVSADGLYAAFLHQFFQSYRIFVSVFFFNSPMPFQVDLTNICIFFAVYYVHFIKKSISVLGTKFS